MLGFEFRKLNDDDLGAIFEGCLFEPGRAHHTFSNLSGPSLLIV
jgi:hypothetical protein